jgi:rubrerythrin
MTSSKDKLAAALKRAIRGEEDGFKFYQIMVDKTKNPDARRKLENLRDDEVRHKKTLYEMYDRFVGGEVGELPEKGLSALTEVFRKGQVETLTTEMQFINLAIEAELAATKFYQDERESSDDPEFRALFDRLADEEHGHYEILQAEKQALAGNYSWFSLDSTQPLED